MMWILALLLVLLGLAGTVLPGLPGPILVFAGIVMAAWADDFARIGPWTLAVLGIMTAVAHLIDFAAAALGVRRAGASGRAVAGAGLGALIGLLYGLPGLIIGPFVGAALAELTVRPDLRAAGKAGAAAWIGFIIGNIAKVAILVTMLAVAAVRLLFF
jgi:uncharacterized protein